MSEESVPLNSTDNLLLNQNQILDGQVKAALAQKIEALGGVELPSFNDYLGVQIRDKIEQQVADQGHDASLVTIGRPTNKNAVTNGVDLAINVVPFSSGTNLRPPEIANNLAAHIADNNEMVENGSTAGPFVNIKLDYERVAPLVLNEVFSLGDHYGHFREGDPKVIVIDYSAPNVAKNMTAAHLRSTIIGHSLSKIEQASGNIPFGINHIGDWGTQFGKIIYEYRKELDERGQDFINELEDDPTSTLMRIYRAFSEREDNDSEAVDSAREIFRDLERGDPELVDLWQKIRDWSMRDFAPTYERLGVDFDAVQGESFYEDRMDEVVNEALEQGVLQRSENGAIVFPGQTLTNPLTGQVNDKIMRDKEGQPREEIVVKPNGGTVYLTRDLAAIKYRAQELGADEILYVIGKEQEAHCLKLFAIADKMGHIALGNALHISFGHLNVDGRKMKSRAGKVVLLNDILDESEAEAERMWKKHNPEDEHHELTEQEHEAISNVGIGAVIFSDLRQHRIKDIEFNLDFGASVKEGSASYIQYTNARLRSVLDKVGQPEPIAELPPRLQFQEKEIVSLMSEFPLVVAEAAQDKAPHKIATYLTSLCKSVNSFYKELPIKNAESYEERNFRLNLAAAAKQVINNAANLVHIELPEKM